MEGRNDKEIQKDGKNKFYIWWIVEFFVDFNKEWVFDPGEITSISYMDLKLDIKIIKCYLKNGNKMYVISIIENYNSTIDISEQDLIKAKQKLDDENLMKNK